MNNALIKGPQPEWMRYQDIFLAYAKRQREKRQQPTFTNNLWEKDRNYSERFLKVIAGGAVICLIILMMIFVA